MGFTLYRVLCEVYIVGWVHFVLFNFFIWICIFISLIRFGNSLFRSLLCCSFCSLSKVQGKRMLSLKKSDRRDSLFMKEWYALFKSDCFKFIFSSCFSPFYAKKKEQITLHCSSCSLYKTAKARRTRVNHSHHSFKRPTRAISSCHSLQKEWKKWLAL